jgi:tRNA threonylcarbamoyladenosine biosynthesis protein TsaB
LNDGFTHAENLHLFIEQALKETGLSLKNLSAIAVSKGPGSYTGLRIGVSAAKGLAYALCIPLTSIDTLQIMAAAAHSSREQDLQMMYCPMIDARRMEVYTAVYDREMNIKMPVESLIVDEKSIEVFGVFPKVCFFGDGMPKCRELLKNLDNVNFTEEIHPSARFMPALVNQKFLSQNFEQLAYFEPFYLKDFMIGKKGR